MSVSIDTSELDALARSLGKAAGGIGARTAAVLRKTAYDIERSAKAQAPVDTGALRASISTSFSGDGRHGTMAAEIGPTVEYGIYLELGTSRMPPQPYLAPAYEQHIGSLEAALGAAVENVL